MDEIALLSSVSKVNHSNKNKSDKIRYLRDRMAIDYDFGNACFVVELNTICRSGS